MSAANLVLLTQDDAKLSARVSRAILVLALRLSCWSRPTAGRGSTVLTAGDLLRASQGGRGHDVQLVGRVHQRKEGPGEGQAGHARVGMEWAVRTAKVELN